MPNVYHLLPEAEIFSEFAGGAISRWVANVLRNDVSGRVVACTDHCCTELNVLPPFASKDATEDPMGNSETAVEEGFRTSHLAACSR
jgi:hypothetical protein